MKKFLSLLMMLALLLSLSVFALAEEKAEIVEYRWSDAESVFKEEFAGQSTKWYIEEVDAALWLPDAFTAAELTAEDRAQDLIDVFTSADNSTYLMLSYSEVENFSVVGMFAVLKDAGNDVQVVSVNDIPAVLLRDREHESLVLMFQTKEGKLFQVVFYPLTDDESFYELVIDSIQPYVEEVENAPVPVNPVSGLISK